MENKVISNFWTALIASAVLVTTALLLEDHEHCGKILVMQGLLFGLRAGDQAVKTYQARQASIADRE